MGGAPTKHEELTERFETRVGILKITILGVQINDHEKRKYPNVKIRVSNQHFTTDHLPAISKDVVGGDTFAYVINSFYKAQGRIIEVGYFSGDSLVSFGSVDADPIIEGKGSENFRVILSHNKQSMHGFIHLRAVFEVLPIHTLTFRFEEAISRRKAGHIGDDRVAVRLTLGEQVRMTEFQVDSPKAPPNWVDTKYSFKIPDGVSRGLIELVDDKDRIVGSADIDVNQLVDAKEEDEVLHSQTLYYAEGQKMITAADLRYSCIRGQVANFQPRTEQFNSAIRGSRSKNKFVEAPRQSSLDK